MKVGDLVKIKGVPSSFCQATRDGGFDIVISKVSGIDSLWVQVICSPSVHRLFNPQRLEVISEDR